MTEVFITLILVALIAFREWIHHKEAQKLVNALIAKNADEVRDLTIADNTNIKVKEEMPKREDIVEESMMNDAEFQKRILDPMNLVEEAEHGR